MTKCEFQGKVVKGLGLSRDRSLHSFYSNLIEQALADDPSLIAFVSSLVLDLNASASVHKDAKGSSFVKGKLKLWDSILRVSVKPSGDHLDTNSHHLTGTCAFTSHLYRGRGHPD